MAKGRKTRGAPHRQATRTTTASAARATPPVRTDTFKDAENLAKVEAELEASTPVPPEIVDEIEVDRAEQPAADPGLLNMTRVKILWDNVKFKEDGWLRAKAATEAERAELAAERFEYETRRADIETREAAVAAAEAEIEVQRSAARAGFAADRSAITREAVERRDQVFAEAALKEEDAQARAQQIVADGRAAVAALRGQLTQERERLAEADADVNARRFEVERQVARVEAERTRFQDLVREQAGDDLEELESQVESLQRVVEREKVLRARSDEERDAVVAKFATYDDPADAQRRIETLTEQVDALRQELVDRPVGATVQELKATRMLLAAAESRALEMHDLYAELNRVHQDLLLQVGDRDVSEAIIATLTTQKETLTQEIERLGAEWKQAQAREDAKVPFPACTAYDSDPTMLAPSDTREVDSLSDLAVEVQARMANSPNGSFSYSDSDVRLFLGGLASSRLHLLQGLSGTGKTSLPREFFQALAGDSAVQIVEVQAGWRDKDDLFGFYNAFEKRFFESEFTKAVYRALLPANTDRPMVIVLDEMNLAHPEQYFGTMLSMLENVAAGQPLLPMLTSPLANTPAAFVNQSQLPLPENIWFVGTANHDETTVAFADKTHDRAHVQELPSRHPPIEVKAIPAEADPVSFHSMRRAFGAAAQQRASEAERATTFLNRNVRDLVEPFGVGWANRLPRQIEHFVPVVVESGGTMTEAVDHLVATKLVRKLENRFDVNHDDLFQLAEDLGSAWSALSGDGQPAKSVARIQAEARRLRGRSGG
jgi:hypothetical protein